MKTKAECLEFEISKFRYNVDKVEWFFDAIEEGNLTEGCLFWLFDGTEYLLCICIGFDESEYDINYSGKNPEDIYTDINIWSLYLVTRVGNTIHPFTKPQ